MKSWFAKLRRRSLAVRGGLVCLTSVGLYLLVAPVAGLVGGWAGLAAAAAAAAACLAGAVAAILLSHALSKPERVLYGLLAGTVARMGIPLGFALACHLHGGALADAGLLYYLLVFYPVTLAVETALSLPETYRNSDPPHVGDLVL